MPDLLSLIRKRFLEEFNRARLVKGAMLDKKVLAEKIGMTPAQVTRLQYQENPTTPSHEQIFALCRNHGADLHYIYFGERTADITQNQANDLLKRLDRLEKVAGLKK